VLRSILVALDETAASAAAQQLALRLAKRFASQITGLAVLDRAYITAATAVGIGGMAYKEHRDQVKLEEAKAFLARLESIFKQSCEASDANWQVLEAEGAPHKLIETESGRHDLLVIGKDTDFHFDVACSTSETVQRLLKDNPRPLVICPDSAPASGPIVAAYDGSLRASRALHMLILLGLADDTPCTWSRWPAVGRRRRAARPMRPSCSASTASKPFPMASRRVPIPRRSSWRKPKRSAPR
jgi:hypothetical protein